MHFEKCCQLSFHYPQMLQKEETIIHMDLTDNLGAGEIAQLVKCIFISTRTQVPYP